MPTTYKFFPRRLVFRPNGELVPLLWTIPVGTEMGSFTRDSSRMPTPMSKSRKKKKNKDDCQTTNGYVQNGISVGICTHCIHVFAHWALICMLSKCLFKKNYASELSRKFIRSELLVGWQLKWGVKKRNLTVTQGLRETVVGPAVHLMGLPLLSLWGDLQLLIGGYVHSPMDHDLCIVFILSEHTGVVSVVDAMGSCEDLPANRMQLECCSVSAY